MCATIAAMLKQSTLRFLVLVVAAVTSLAFACQKSTPEGGRAERVIVASYDSVGADLVVQWLADPTITTPDGLAGMAQQGLSAERLRIVDPTLTAVVHNSLVTGRNAAGTGIVGNDFRMAGAPIDERVSGFSTSSDAVTLWETARDSGLRVATLMWPGADAGALDRIGDFGAVWPGGDFGAVWPGPPVSPSEIIEFKPDIAETTGEVPSSDGLSPLMWRFSINLGSSTPDRVEVLVALVDSNPDGRPRYDTVAVRRTDGVDWSYAGEMEWLEIAFDAQGPDDLRPRRYGAWCKVLHVDRMTGGMRFYRGGANRLTAYPDSFEDRITEAIGPWPGEADRMVADWWLDLAHGIDLDTFVEQTERLDRYLDRMLGWVLAEEDADLVFVYHSSADVYQHASLIVDTMQWAFSPGRVLAAEEGLKRVGRSIDRSVASIWNSLDPQRDALVVVSDHGQIPIFEVVRPNRALADAGMVTIIDDGGHSRPSPDTPMLAITGGAFFHLYLNLEGREPGGVVSEAEAPELLRRAARVLADLEVEGRPAVERIFTRKEAGAVGLDSPSSGDLVVFLTPGFAASGGLDGPALEPSRYYGQHGFLASHDEMCGMLFARGAGIEKARLGEIHLTEVAPMVARWLGFEFGSRTEFRSVP
ncbi:MAG: alkaline phosphatase family protein [Acidobacteriota bacterium]